MAKKRMTNDETKVKYWSGAGMNNTAQQNKCEGLVWIIYFDGCEKLGRIIMQLGDYIYNFSVRF